MQKQKLLLIAPLFFGYYKEIVKEAEQLGYEVTYLCDAPSDSNLSKAISRVNKNFIRFKTESYFKKTVIPLIEGKDFDFVLVVAGMTFSFTPDMVKAIKDKLYKAKFIIYQWDSEKNLKHVKNIHQYFDKIVTFDRCDFIEKDYYEFLPLFYTKIYESIGEKSVTDFKYDCSYVGTAHPKKFQDINMISYALKEEFKNQFIYHYMPSKLKYYYHKLLATEYKEARTSDFQYQKVSSDEMMKIFELSKCILDAPQGGQVGLTIRTIECLGARRKLITSNEDVVNYDFYTPENIYVYSGDIDFNSPFFTQPYKEIDKEIYQKYSLREWLQTLLDFREKENINENSSYRS